MKAAVLPLLLLLGACAPKATVVEEPIAPTRKPATSEKPADPLPETLSPPNDGLLAPAGLLALPGERDMKPTVDPKQNPGSTVIATPPSN